MSSIIASAVVAAEESSGGIHPIAVGVGVFIVLLGGLALTYAFRNANNRH